MKKFLSPAAIFLLLGTTWAATRDSYCPPNEEIIPCRCVHGNFYIVDGTAVLCRNITNTRLLKTVIQKFRGYKINLLEFGYFNLSFLPAGLFSGTWIQRLRITDSIIGNLYSVKEYSPSPFDGLDDSLEELHVIRTKDPSKWLWPNLKNLKKLKVVEFMQSPLHFVGHVFSEIGEGSMQSIAVRYSTAYRIHPQAFSDLMNISYADFEGNYLPYMSRTMFPDPAPKLTYINLRYNSLDVLPEDMFVNMPALVTLDLSQNMLTTVPEKMYAPLWKQLQFFDVSGNPLECNCELKWLKSKMDEDKYRFIQLLFAKCSSPPDLAGLTLESLNVDQLIC